MALNWLTYGKILLHNSYSCLPAAGRPQFPRWSEFERALGLYIVDFVSFDRKLVIEIDGGQHNEEETRKRDDDRTKGLPNIKVLE